MTDRRSMRSYIVDPKKQFRFSVLLLTAPCLSVSLLLMMVVYEVKHTVVRLADENHLDPQVVDAIQGALSSAVFVSLLLVAGIIVTTVLVGIRFSHRIHGPMVSVRRHIASLASGDYRARLNLRKDDDFLEIRDALNGLAESLEKRHGK